MRRIKDFILNGITYVSSGIGIFILIAILVFIFRNGFGSLSMSLLTSDYYQTTYNTNIIDSTFYKLGDFEDPKIENSFFSETWGISLKNGNNVAGEKIVEINYVAVSSPFKSMNDVATGEKREIGKGYALSKIIMTNENDDFIMALAKDGAEEVVKKLEQATIITDMIASTGGGGIRGSLLTTLYLIILTLTLALPTGICAAIYLHEFSLNNRLTRFIRIMIDMTSGIPSIIFGLAGAVIFIPFMNGVINSNGGSIASGALTLTLILLPIIIKTTEEALKVIPVNYRSASLALGASKTQTIFKVVLPNAVSGILTATLLSIGRIIGESAALIYAVGTAIKDNVAINEKSTSLAVHIWSLMSGENPNFALASAIATIIMIIVFILSISVKLISQRLNKIKVGN